VSITHKKSYSAASDAGGSGLSGSFADVGATEINVDQSFAASTSNQSVTMSFTIASLQSLFLVCDKGCTIRTNGTGTSEVQTVTITGTPAGGTFALAYQGQITAPLAYNAAAADVQTALRALSTIGGSNVTCAGGALPGTPVTVTFAGTLASTNVSQITSNGAGLTGGSGPAVAVTTTTPGKPSDVITLVAGTPLSWSLSETYWPCPFTVDVTAWYASTTVAARLQGKILTS
jgi:hypothetical protein